MADDTIQVTATLFPVAKGFEARPGDHVMVVAGVVVGVFTGKVRQLPPPEPKPVRVATEPKQLAGPKPAPKNTGKTKDAAKEAAKFKAKIAEMIAKKPGTTTQEMGDELGIPRTSDRERGRITMFVNKMIADGSVRFELIGKGATQGRRFFPVTNGVNANG